MRCEDGLRRLVGREHVLNYAEAEQFDSRERQVGHGSGLFMRSSIALTEDFGYV